MLTIGLTTIRHDCQAVWSFREAPREQQEGFSLPRSWISSANSPKRHQAQGIMLHAGVCEPHLRRQVSSAVLGQRAMVASCGRTFWAGLPVWVGVDVLHGQDGSEGADRSHDRGCPALTAATRAATVWFATDATVDE